MIMLKDKLAMVASTVSSKMISTMAQYEGFKFVECLTGESCTAWQSNKPFEPRIIPSPPNHYSHAGFKYIGNTALDLVRDGFEVPFGYEEAIGFMFDRMCVIRMASPRQCVLKSIFSVL